jgi:Glycosyl hydrolase family 26
VPQRLREPVIDIEASYSRRSLLRGAAACGLATVLTGCDVGPWASPPRLKTPYKFGLHVDERSLDVNLAHAEKSAKRKADVVLLFAKLSDPISGKIRRMMHAGYEVALTLEWWTGGQSHDPAYSLRDIAAGRHDASFDRWLQSFRDLPRPLHLRPLHEFNGDWYPWGVYAPGNLVSDFIPAWRHVTQHARAVAGDRVLMQLCYNRVHAQGSHERLSRFYPGDEYVDELAINGYMRPGKRQWKQFVEIIGPFYQQLRAINPRKPLWIGETACTEQGGDKAAWITRMFETVLSTHPVACLTWFDEFVKAHGEPDRDWPFDTSKRSLHAFQQGVVRGST